MGRLTNGSLEGSSQKQALEVLREKKIVVIDIGEEKEDEFAKLTKRFNKVKTEDLVNFTRQLSTMISAGLPLTEALAILQSQSSPAMAVVVGKVMVAVQEGATLSEAMKKSGDTFPAVYLALVKAGEAAGVLDTILNRLATSLEKQRDFRNKTKGALIYPIIVIVGMILVGVIMMIFVVPKMTELYQDFGATLPLPTQILIFVSNFMVNFWYILLLMVVGIGYFGLKWSKTEAGGRIIEETMFKLPIMGPLRKQIVFAEFSRTMSLLITAGISILDAMRIVADAVDSKLIGDSIRESSQKVEKGQPLSAVLAARTDYPPIIAQMLAVGEQTGKVDEILTRLADYFEGESEVAVKSLTTAIEPLIMVVMGVGVGFLVMAVIMPIYNLTSQF